jgi:hypothetical protein
MTTLTPMVSVSPAADAPLGSVREQQLFDYFAARAQSGAVDFAGLNRLANPGQLLGSALGSMRGFVEKAQQMGRLMEIKRSGHMQAQSKEAEAASGKGGHAGASSQPLSTVGDRDFDRAIEAMSEVLGFSVQSSFITGVVSQTGRSWNALTRG